MKINLLTSRVYPRLRSRCEDKQTAVRDRGKERSGNYLFVYIYIYEETDYLIPCGVETLDCVLMWILYLTV